MANSADGSIRIDTELDNSGFEQGTDKLLAALKSLQESVDAIGDTLGNGLDSVIKQLRTLSSQATATNQQVTQSADQAAAANQNVAQSAQQAAQATQQAGQAAAQSNQQIAQTAQEAASATQQMTGTPQKLITEYNSIGKAAQSLHDQLVRLSTTAEIGFKNDAQILRFRDSVDVVARKIQELRDRMNALGNTKIPTEDYKWLQAEIAKAERQLAMLDDRQAKMDETGVKQSSAAYKRLQYDIDLATQKLQAYKAEMADMEASGEAFTLGANTAEYSQLASTLASLEGELGEVQAAGEGAEVALSGAGSANPILAALATAAQKAANAVWNMAKAIAKAAIHTFVNAVKRLGAGLKTVAANAKKAVSGLLHFNKAAKSGINPVNALIKGLTSFKTMLISSIKRTFMSSVFSTLKEGVQQFALYSEEFNRAMSNMKNTGAQLGTQIGSLVANVLTTIEPIITRILSLINSVITAISALFAKLSGKSTVAVAVKQTKSYADSLDDAAGSAGGAAAAQKKFNAELYGWDELNRQSKQDDSGGGGGATTPLWEDVPVDDILGEWEDVDWFQLGYDWAEKIANALDSIPWDKIKAAAYKLGQHCAELLNGVFANLHLADSLGKTIAEALNTGLSFALGFLEKFDFKQFGKWAGTLWNAFVDAFDFDALEKAIKLGGNGIVDAFTSFFKTISATCEKLGGGIAKIFNGIFADIDFSGVANAILLGIHDINLALKGFNDNIKWDEIAQNIKNGINTLISGMVLDEDGNLTNVWAENGKEVGRLIGGLWDTAYEVISGLDFKQLGESLALWLNNVVNEIDPEDVGGTLGGIIRGIIDTAFSFKESINADELAEKLKAALQTIVDKMNEVDPATGLNGWQKLGSTIAGLGNAIVTAFESIPWGEVAVGVAQTIGTALSDAKLEIKLALAGLAITKIASVVLGSEVGKQVALALGQKLLTALGNAWPALGGAIKSALASLGSSLVTFLTTDVLAASAGEIGAAIIAGLFIGGEIGKLLDNYVIGPLIEAFDGDKLTAELYKNFHWFGEGGFFDEMWTDNASFLENVQIWGQALCMMFSDLGQDWKDAWDIVSSDVSSVVGNIKSSVSEGWNNLKENTSAMWQSVSTTVGTKVSEIKAGISEGWTNIKTNTSTFLAGVQSDMQSKWASIKSSVSTTVSNIKTDITTNWNTLQANTSAFLSSVWTDMQTKWSSIKTTVSTAVTNIKTNISNSWNTIKTNTMTTMQNIFSTIQSKWNSAKTAISTAVNNMKTAVTTGWSNMVSTIKTKLTEIYNNVKSKMSEVVNHIKGINLVQIGKDLINGLLNGLKSAWENVTSWISSATSGLTEKVKSILGIASPSKVWAQIGVFLDEGLTQGLESGERKMLSTASGLAESLTDRMSNVDGSVALTNDGDIERLNVITSQLSGIAGIIDHIAQALASMGGLQIPQVAMGTVVPYRTKAAAMAGGGNYEMENAGYTDEMVQLLRNIRDYLAAGGGNGGDKDIKVIIDGREVFNAVVNENNRAIRRTGGVSPLKV